MYSDAWADVCLDHIQEIRDADIINLHWVAGLVDYSSMATSLAGKKIVWTLHDMNPFTGGCHYAGRCNKYEKSCGACPQLGSTSEDDLAAKVWTLKQQAFRGLDITVVAPSRWIAECASRSALFRGRKVLCVPYGVPEKVYRPYPRETIRSALDIPIETKVILFGADNLLNVRKGFSYLLDGLKSYRTKGESPVMLVTFGSIDPQTRIRSPYPVLNLGSIFGDRQLAGVYSLADVFVIPSLEDNLPNTVLEAMACGVPVVGFGIGGIPDMVEHRKTGFVARPEDMASLIEGIDWVLFSAPEENLRQACRAKLLQSYTLASQAACYLGLYSRMWTDPVEHQGSELSSVVFEDECNPPKVVETNRNQEITVTSITSTHDPDEAGRNAATLSLPPEVRSTQTKVPRLEKEGRSRREMSFQIQEDATARFPKISVITPSYNQGAFIEKTIESVLAQNYPHFEHIVVDGGSSDCTLDILKRYPHLRWLSESDKGQSNAVNKGLRMAEGEIIAWINSDDWYEPGAFHCIAEFFRNNPDKNVVMGDCNLVDERGIPFDKVVNAARGFEGLRQYWVPRSIPTQPAIFFRRRLLDRCGYLDESLHLAMDYDLWMRFAQTEVFHRIPIPVANYRFHKDAKGGDRDWSKFVPEWKLVYERYAYYNSSPTVSVVIPCYNYAHFLTESVESVISQSYQDFEIIIVNDGSTDNTLEVAERLCKAYPSHTIRIIDQVNSGQPAASRNNGISQARGQFILPLDADDKLAPGALELLMGKASSEPRHPVAVFGWVQRFGVEDSRWEAGPFEPNRILRRGTVPYCALFHRSVWENQGGYRTNIPGYEDWDFWIGATVRGVRFLNVSAPVLLYRRTDSNSLVDRARRMHEWLVAGIILNHSSVYEELEVAWAEDYRRRYPQPPKERQFSEEIQRHPDVAATLVACYPECYGEHEFKWAVQYLQDHPFLIHKGIRAAAVPGGSRILNLQGEVVVPPTQQALAWFRESLRALEERNFPEAERLMGLYRQSIRYETFASQDRRSWQLPRISVIIVAYRTRHLLLECLDSVFDQTYRDYEVIVVDNGGNREIHENLRSYPILHIECPDNLVLSEGRNIGVHYARGEYVAFLDDDARVPTNYLESIDRVFREYDIVGMRGKVHPKSTPLAHSRADHYDLGEIPLPSTIDTEGNSAFSRKAYQEMGGMNPLLFGMEGLDLSYRLAVRYGPYCTVYWPETLIYHDFAVTEDKLGRKLAQHALVREYLLYKFPDIYQFHDRLRSYAANGSLQLQGKGLIPTKSGSAPASSKTDVTVTIAIVTYNRARYIGQAIESALDQRVPADEILVVDDGSTDNTAEIVAGFSSPKIRYIRKEHSGAPQTRNRAVREARSEFILWLDSDDCLLPHAVASHKAALKQCPDADVLYGDLLVADESLQSQFEWPYPDFYGDNRVLLGRLVRGNCLPNPGTMIRKSCIERFGGYDESFRRAHDYELWSRLAGNAVFKHCGTLVCRYRIHADSLSSNPERVEKSFDARVVKGLLDRCRPEHLYGDIPWGRIPYEEAKATAFWTAALTLLGFEDVPGAVECLKKSRESAPSREAESLLSLLATPSRVQDPRSLIRRLDLPVPPQRDFDEAFYLSQYPDLLGEVRSGRIRSGWEHFLAVGKYENRLNRTNPWTLSFSRASGEAPMVSVIIPCFNQAEYLEHAVESVVRQTLQDWEIIIVNDGSTDDTGRIARSLIQEHGSRRIHLLDKEHGGLAAARNSGVRESKGKYILPLDADDLLEPTMLQECVRALEGNPRVAIAYTDVRQFGAVERLVPSIPYDFDILCHMNFMCCTSLYRREAFDAVGGYNPNMVWGYEDWDFWIGCGEKGFFGEHVPKPLFRYRRKANSMVAESRRHDRKLKARIVLNHPAVFSPEQLHWAKGIEAKDPRIMALPDQPHFIPRFGPTRRSSSRAETTGGKKAGMKVLFTMYGWNDTGGGTTFPKSVAEELVRRGHRVSVFYASLRNDPAMPPYSVLKEEEDGVVLYGVYNRPALFVDPDCPEREILDEGILGSFREVLDEVQPEVVHFHNFHGLTFAMAQETRNRGIHSCYTPHNYHMIDPQLYLFRSDLSLWTNTDILENSEAVQRNPDKRALYEKRAETTRKLLNEWVDMTLAVSSRQRDLLIQHGANADRIAVVHQSPASTDDLWNNPELSRQGTRPLHDPLRIGFIGGVMPHKGVHVLVAAAQHFDSSQAEFHVYGFGSAEYVQRLQSLDRKGRVVFHGNYTHDMLESIARELDIAVVPSLWEDCAPLVLLELMAMRLPILGASIGGIPDFVKEGVNGFLYPHDSVEALCRCIEYCIQNRKIIREMRSSLRQPHSFHGYVDHLETIYPLLSDGRIGSASRHDLLVRFGTKGSKSTILWEGSQFVIHSLALVNRELCLQLMDRGHEISILPFEPDQFGPEKDPRFARIADRVHKPLSREPDLHVRHQWPPNFTTPPEGRWVMIQPWEYGRLPEEWIEPMSNLVDEIWVPSRHVLKTYLASGIPADRVHVIPNGVNTRLFHPQARPVSLSTGKKYKFLFLGGTIWRKGIDLLLQAYGAAFRREDDVVLVIKDMGQNSFYRGQGAGKLIAELQETPKFPEILYLTQNLDEREMPGLITACDCLVHPYRGEGFGLPVIEAMACGLPVIVTEGGATDDFCTPETAYFIPSRPKGYLPNDMRLVGGVLWVVEPDVNALVNQLRHVHEHPEEARRKGLRALEKVRSHYTWDKVAEQVAKRAEILKNRPIRRMSQVARPVDSPAASPALALQTV